MIHGPTSPGTRARGWRLAALGVLLSVLASAPVLAADAEDDEAAPDTRWSLSLATVVDQKSAREFDGLAGYALGADTRVQVGANVSDSSSNSTTGVGTSAVDLGLSHEFGDLSVDGRLRHWQATDILNSLELSGGAAWQADAWSLGPRLALRRSRFDPISVGIAVPGVTLAAANPTARCTLDSLGYGLAGEYAGEVWGAHLDGSGFRYGSASCDFEGQRARVDRGLLAQLLGAGADRLARAAARSPGSRDAPVESRIGGGVSWSHEDLRLSVDYSQATTFVLGIKAQTLAATATADLGGGSGVDVTLGATRSVAYGTIAFVGFAVRANF